MVSQVLRHLSAAACAVRSDDHSSSDTGRHHLDDVTAGGVTSAVRSATGAVVCTAAAVSHRSGMNAEDGCTRTSLLSLCDV